MRKKVLAIVGILMIMMVVPLGLGHPSAMAADSDVPNPDCTAAVLMDAQSGKILYEKNGDAKTQPASVTKMMTALLVVENLDLDKEVTVPPQAVGILGCTANLKQGEKLTVRQLLNVMMIESANDTAIALALEVSDSLNDFYKKMNRRAKELGMLHTHYKSPNGLIEDNNHYMSPKDTAILARELLRHKELAAIVRKTKYEVPKTNKSKVRKIENTNKMLFDDKTHVKVKGKSVPLKYDGTIGVKTGTMNASGYCFAGAAKRDDLTLISVVMHANGPDKGDSRFTASIEMLDYGFANFRNQQVMEVGEGCGHVWVKGGHHTLVNTVAKDGAFATLPKEADEDIVDYKVVFQKNLKAPLKAGTKVGVINVYESGKKAEVFDVVLKKDVTKGGPWSNVYISDLGAVVIFGVLVVIIVMMLLYRKGRKKRRQVEEERMRRIRGAQARSIAARRAEKRKRGWPY